MKRIWSVVFALVMVLSLVPTGVFAQTTDVTVTDDVADTVIVGGYGMVVDSGVCGDNLTWTMHDSGTLVISGEGEMWHYYEDSVPWSKDFTDLIIEDGVTSIGLYAFSDCTSLVSVTIGNGVTNIMEGAFYGCTSLTSINIPDGVTWIGWTAFCECDSLVSITLPNSVTTIDTGAFSFCDSLTSIIIPDSVTSIDNTAFYGCPNLSIYGHSGSTAETYAAENDIPFVALDGQMPDGGEDDEPTEPTVPDTPIEPDDELSITAGETLTVEIVGDEITYIKFIPSASGTYTFTALADQDTYGYLHDANYNELASDDDSGEDYNFSITYDLAGGVTYYWGARYYSWSSGSFDVQLVCDAVDCTHANTTEHAEQSATCTTDGYTAGVFCEDCEMWMSGHKVIPAHHVDDNADAVCDLCGGEIELLYGGECGDNLTFALYESGLLIIRGTGEMDNWNFWDVSAPWLNYSEEIRKVVIEEGVTSIGQNAFCSEDSYYDYNDHFYTILTEIVIPNTVTTIHTNGISGLDVLETITLPASVTTMVGAAINNNYALKRFVVAEENPVYKAVDGVLFSKDGKTLVSYPIGSLAESYTVPQGTETIAAYAFSQCSTVLTEVIFNEELTFIDDEAFQNCDGLTSIELPDSLKELGGGVFQECSNLLDISLPNGMTRIGGLAFQCTAYFDDWNNWEDNVLYLGSYMLDTMYCPTHLDWDEWKEKSGTLTVRAGTTLIADEAADMIDLDAVVFNDELQHIGFCAFGWLDIASASLPDSLLTLGDWAFYNCEQLVDIRLGDHLQYIGHDVFGMTPYDTAENYVDGVLYYGPYVLGFNDALPQDVVIREGTTLIAERAFWKEDGSLTTPDYGAGMQSITFPESLTTICDGAFYSCNNLKSVTIPATVTNIGHQAFGWIKGYDLDIDEETFEKMSDFAISGYTDSAAEAYAAENDIPFVALDAEVPDIDGDDACGTITNSGTCDGDNLTWTLYDSGTLVISGEGEMFGNYWDLGIEAPWRDLDFTSVIIEEGVTLIGEGAFAYCTSLESVTIPASVSYCYDEIFYNCPSLHSINVAEDNLYFTSVDGVWFNKDKTVLICYPSAKAETTYTIPDGVTDLYCYAFEGCTSLVTIDIPNSVTGIGYRAFQSCLSLISITIPDSVTYIGWEAFEGCTSLTSITILNSVTSIEESAFALCDNLTIYGYIGSTAETYAAENDIPFVALDAETPDIDGDDAYGTVTNSGDCGANVTWALYDSGTLVISGEGAMWDYSYDAPWSDLDITTVIIEQGVTSIGDGTFSYCTSLISVTIPDSVTSLGKDAFLCCTSLTSITIPDGVTSVESGLFEGCTSLASITIPDSVTNIGSCAFADCTSLTSVIIPGSVVSIEGAAFYGCTALTSITIPNSVTSIGVSAFFDCCNLTISGYSGSATEAYAAENNIPFNALDEELPDDESLPGDVNGDDVVNNKDLGLVQRYINGWAVEINENVGDVNDDGNINNKDLGLLQRYINGWDVELK